MADSQLIYPTKTNPISYSLEDVSEAFTASWALLQTVKITVPVDRDDPMPYSGLGKLRYLLFAPITKPDVHYSLFPIICQEHNAAGYRVEGISINKLRHIVLSFDSEGLGRLKDCPDCGKKDTIVSVLKDTRGASNMLEVKAQNTVHVSSGRLCFLPPENGVPDKPGI